jgi:hypothetical protein
MLSCTKTDRDREKTRQNSQPIKKRFHNASENNIKLMLMNFMKHKTFFALVFMFIWLNSGTRENSQPANPGSPRLIPLGENLVKVEHDNGEYQIFDTSPIHSIRSTAKKTIQFNISEYDPEQFIHRFKHFASVPLGNDSHAALPADTDQDSLIEMVGNYKDYDDKIPTLNSIYEQDSPFSNNYQRVLNEIADYHSPAVLVTDVNQNGRKELAFKNANTGGRGAFLDFYESPGVGILATEKIISHRMFEVGNIAQFPREVDLDSDGKKEILYMGSDYDSAGIVNGYTYIAEYIDSLKTIKRVWSIAYQTEHPGSIAGDWAVGDFDLDGKNEIVTGDIDGNVFWIEHTGKDNDYKLLSTEKVYFPNVYYFTEGDDLDGDGRPECFVGGAGFIDDIWTTILLCYETTGDNEFENTLEIQIIGAGGLGSTPNLLQADVTGDGKKELVFFLGNTILVFTPIGDDNYELFWMKSINYWIAGAVGDATGDNKDDIIFGYLRLADEKYAYFSDIYTYDTTSTKVNEMRMSISQFNLFPAFPNPFNSAITISWSQPASDNVTVSIYNIVGQEIKTLTNDEWQSGKHHIIWQGNDDKGNEVSSGVYFCRVQIGSGAKVQKLAFIK